VVTISNATLFVMRDGGKHSWFKAKLGQLRTVQPMHEGTEDVVLFANDTTSAGEALFTIDLTTKVDDANHDAKVSCSIGPATLIYSQQMWMELVDYIYEGVLGAIFLDLSERVDEVVVASRKSGARWHVLLEWSSPLVMLPTIANGMGEEHLALACSAITAYNSFSPPVAPDVKWKMMTRVLLSDARVDGVMTTERTQLLNDPVNVDLSILQPLGVDDTMFRRDITGSVSPIEIILKREQYYLVHRMLNGNLLFVFFFPLICVHTYIHTMLRCMDSWRACVFFLQVGTSLQHYGCCILLYCSNQSAHGARSLRI